MSAKSDKVWTVALLQANPAMAGSLFSVLDILETANRIARLTRPQRAAPFRVRLLADRADELQSFSSQPIRPTGDLEEAFDADLVLVPAIAAFTPQEVERALDSCGALIGVLRRLDTDSCRLAAWCTGNYLLAEAGHLDGRHATTAWWLCEHFRRRYPRVIVDEDSLVIHDPRVSSSGTGNGAQDLLLKLVSDLTTARLAGLVAHYMLMDTGRTSQAIYRLPLPLHNPDPVLRRAINKMRRELHGELRMEAVAADLNLSPRSLVRLFNRELGRSPQACLQELRVQEARRLLEETELPLEQILERIGYRDPSSFRRLFGRVTSCTPAEYRRRFRPGAFDAGEGAEGA